MNMIRLAAGVMLAVAVSACSADEPGANTGEDTSLLKNKTDEKKDDKNKEDDKKHDDENDGKKRCDKDKKDCDEDKNDGKKRCEKNKK